jgi:uncharacterized damage-inducible protein DinB
MNAEVARLIDQLERAIDGDAWHGDPVMLVIERATFRQADTRPARAAHSIREIVRHMTGWTKEVHGRMNGAPAGEPRGGDWPPPSGRGEAAFREEVAALQAAHQALIADLRKLTDDQLFEPTNDPRNRATGSGVTRYVLLHGLAQHHAYHSGQIAILAKIN